MTKSELEEIKSLILSQMEEIKDDIRHLQEVTKPITLDSSIGRVSRMDAINNKAINDMSLRDKKKTLQRLEKAMDRYDDGKLGTCMKCGGEIPLGRLKIMPYTTRCVKCA